MHRDTPRQLTATIFGRPITAWHGIWVGAFSLLGGLWLLSTALFGWPSPRLPAIGGAVVVPFAFLSGLAAFAFSVVALFRRRDWRLVMGALLGLSGVVTITVAFLSAMRGVGQ
jgi:hypothetical protein